MKTPLKFPLIVLITLIFNNTVFSQTNQKLNSISSLDTATFSLPTLTLCSNSAITPSNVLQTINTYTVIHYWDFGNGGTVSTSSPGAQTYTAPGVYTIKDSAIVGNVFFTTYLKKITVLAVSCSDVFGNPVDLFTVISNSTSTIYTSPTQNDLNPPVIFNYTQTPFGLLLNANSTYSVGVIDEDVSYNDNCGTVSFNSNASATTFTLTNGGLTLKVDLARTYTVNPIDTIITAIQFTVVPSPIINVTTSNTLICLGDNVTINATGANNYNWQPINVNTASVSVSPTVTTIYTIYGTNTIGCTSSYSIGINVSSCTSINNITSTLVGKLKLYPNPTQSILNIELISLSTNVLIEIMNNLGQIVYSEKLFQNKSSINTANLTKGTYFIKASNSFNQTETGIFIKE